MPLMADHLETMGMFRMDFCNIFQRFTVRYLALPCFSKYLEGMMSGNGLILRKDLPFTIMRAQSVTIVTCVRTRLKIKIHAPERIGNDRKIWPGHPEVGRSGI
jgi:hypothetical protein